MCNYSFPELLVNLNTPPPGRCFCRALRVWWPARGGRGRPGRGRTRPALGTGRRTSERCLQSIQCTRGWPRLLAAGISSEHLSVNTQINQHKLHFSWIVESKNYSCQLHLFRCVLIQNTCSDDLNVFLAPAEFQGMRKAISPVRFVQWKGPWFRHWDECNNPGSPQHFSPRWHQHLELETNLLEVWSLKFHNHREGLLVVESAYQCFYI